MTLTQNQQVQHIPLQKLLLRTSLHLGHFEKELHSISIAPFGTFFWQLPLPHHAPLSHDLTQKKFITSCNPRVCGPTIFWG
jgi:hypothetical protein